MRFWRNPEFVRHLRAELRPARALTVAVVVMVICGLMVLSAWGQERRDPHRLAKALYDQLLGAQFVLLGVWSALACGQAVSRERELKTFDFLRTTRLTAWELTVGKLLGAPIVAYFVVACSLPVSLVAGVLGGYPLTTLLLTYFLLIIFALFVGLTGIWASMQVEKSTAGAVGLSILMMMTMMGYFGEFPSPGFGAVSILPPLLKLYNVPTDFLRRTPKVFGATVPYIYLTPILYALLGAWLALMLVRNLKKDREQIRLLSRWQAIGFVAFLNFLFFAFLDPVAVTKQSGWDSFRAEQVSGTVIILNAGLLYAVGIAMLTSSEKLKVWWRKRLTGEASYFSETGLPWPWLIPAAVVPYAFLVSEAAGLRSSVPLGDWDLGRAALLELAILAFAARDVLFLQYSNLTRMKRPVFKGILYLCLYYITATVLIVVFSSHAEFLLGLLTPFGFEAEKALQPSQSPGVYVGMAIQIPLTLLILTAIYGRLRRPVKVAAPAAA